MVESKKIKEMLKYTEQDLLIKMENMLLNSLPLDKYHRSKLSNDEQLMLEKVLQRHHMIYSSSFLGTDVSRLEQEEYYLYSMLTKVETKYKIYVKNLRQQGFMHYEISRNYHGIPVVLFRYINEMNYEEYQKYLTLLYLLIYDSKTYQLESLNTISMCELVAMISKELERRIHKEAQKVKV